MRAAELRKMESFFTSLTGLRRYMVDQAAAAAEAGTCDCEVTRDGVYVLRGRCIPAGPVDPPPDHCRTVVHLAARHVLDQLRLPVAHLSDPQLGNVVTELAALVDQAPQLTQRRFVIRLQEVLRTSLAHLATPATDQPEETPDR